MTFRFKPRARKGMTLIDVTLSVVVLTVGTLFVGKFFSTIFDDLAPRGQTNGLRRYLLAEEMMRAQAEGLRTIRKIPLTDTECKLVTEPVGMNYQLTLARTTAPTIPTEQLNYFTVTVSQNGQQIGTLSLSTLRATGTLEGIDEKIGL